jgi:methylglyoxal synthase
LLLPKGYNRERCGAVAQLAERVLRKDEAGSSNLLCSTISGIKEKNMDKKQLTVALIAHDNKKMEIVAWAMKHKSELSHCRLMATGTTGTIVAKETELDVTCFKSGPLGGDQQIGAKIVDGEVDILVFFWDPLSAQPHDVDVKALLRIAVLNNTITACNRATADLIFASKMVTP